MTTEPRASLVKRLKEAVSPNIGVARGVQGVRESARTIPITVREVQYVERMLKDALATIQADGHRLEALRTQGDGEWVLVPREPTEAMIEAGANAPLHSMGNGQYLDAHPQDVWRAMLEVAPTQASSREEG